MQMEYYYKNITNTQTEYTSINKDYTIVKTSSQRSKMKKHIEDSSYLSFDTETTGLNPRKDEVIGFSVSGEPGVAFYYPLCEWNGEKLVYFDENVSECRNILNSLKNKELLMWNGSFDIRMVKNNFSIDLTDSLIAEGMLLKHTIEEEGNFALKKVGIDLQKEIGLNVEEEANKEQIELKENVKKKGGSVTKSNFEMYKADLDILGTYAAADADLTLRVCEYYVDLIEKEGLDSFFFDEEVMPLYKYVTIPMEEHGVKLDLDLLYRSEKEIKEDLNKLENNVIKELEKTDAFVYWYNETVERFVDEVPRGKYAQGIAEYFKLPLPKTATGKYKLAKKALQKLPESEAKSFLLGDIQSLSVEDQFAIKEKIYLEKNKKKINIYSKKQLGEVIFDYMNIQPLSKTEKGSPQLNDKMIEYLVEEGYDWAKELHDYNKLIKIKGSYIDRFLENHEDGFYYFSYKQHGTLSGRYGSDAQQLPRPMEKGQESEVVLKYNNRIRKFFVVENGRKFIDCDYESLEPRVFSHISRDEGLRDIFRKGHDFYSTIAIATEALYEYSADKKADNYLGKLNKNKRQKSKNYSLGVPYGLGGYALGKSLGISTQEAEELVENYLNSYPELKKWMDRSKKMAQSLGYVKSETGRVRHLPQVKKLYKIYGDKLLDFKFRKKLERRFDKKYVFMMYMDYKNGVNNSRNFQIQSMAASIVNRASIAITRKFKDLGIDAWCCAQIHDQLIFNVPEDKTEECKEIIQDLMENTTKLSLDLKAPPEVGDNWYETH